MSYLVDSSVWLEALLKQEQAETAARFLRLAEPSELAISEFSLSSIGIILTTREDRPADYIAFLADLVETGVAVAALDLDQRQQIPAAMAEYGLDFDDAYQYVAAKHGGHRLVSFDSDFRRTPEGAEHPKAVLAGRVPTEDAGEGGERGAPE